MGMRTWMAATVAVLVVGVTVQVASGQVEGDPDRGGDLFVENCAVCHGVEGRGRVGASLESFPGIQVDATLAQTIAQGIDGSPMPAWGEAFGGPLSEADIADIVAYIVSAFGGTEPIAPLPTYRAPEIEPLPEVAGDPSRGAVVYQANCSMCHGDRGQGRIGRPLAKAWPGVNPAVYIREVVREGIPGTTMPAWAQENGGPLSEEQVEDVAAYVLTFEPASVAPTPLPAPQGPLTRTVSLSLLAGLAALIVIALVIYYRRA